MLYYVPFTSENETGPEKPLCLSPDILNFSFFYYIYLPAAPCSRRLSVNETASRKRLPPENDLYNMKESRSERPCSSAANGFFRCNYFIYIGNTTGISRETSENGRFFLESHLFIPAFPFPVSYFPNQFLFCFTWMAPLATSSGQK